MNSAEIKKQIEKAVERVEHLEDIWDSAKRRHFKAWEAEYETWPDEESAIRAREWERSAQKEVDEVTKRLNSAKNELRCLVEKAKAECQTTDPVIHALLQKIAERNLLGR